MKYFYKSSTAVIEGEEYNTYDVYIEDNNGNIENIPDFSVDVDETKEFIQYLKYNKITPEQLLSAAHDFLWFY